MALTQSISEFLCSANMAFAMYPGLTQGAAAAIFVHGSPEQKALYLPKLISGQWTGTMNLTEPQCGTDLGLVRTRAVPQADGSYKITGTKIFISAGEHDLAENIVHLVLARIEGAPEGTKGISLFIVPKFLPTKDGTVGARNAVSCGSIEEKMGIHGNSTCVMNYDDATGWLVAEPNRGLNAMFVMMNEARLGVGMQGLALSEVAYQNAAAYAKERLAGRALTGAKFKDKPADPIIVQPDVRRMLMTMRAFNEAARALVLWTALRSDVAHRSGDAKERQAADDHMGLMTPVIKGVLTDQGFANTVMAQQVFGGHGYIAEHGMEQFVRDARIAMIYEGANGIQALDLVGRKLPRDGGRALQAFFAEVSGYIKEHGADAELAPYVKPLGQALGELQQATMWFMQNALGNPDNAGAGSTDYMHLFGLVALGYMWCLIAEAAKAKAARAATARASAWRRSLPPAASSPSGCCRPRRPISRASRPAPPRPWLCRRRLSRPLAAILAELGLYGSFGPRTTIRLASSPIGALRAGVRRKRYAGRLHLRSRAHPPRPRQGRWLAARSDRAQSRQPGAWRHQEPQRSRPSSGR